MHSYVLERLSKFVTMLRIRSDTEILALAEQELYQECIPLRFWIWIQI
jgi:hypothetical protein